MFQSIIEEFKQLDEVESIALGGSRATKKFDEHSDYDVYVYLRKPLKEEKRVNILSKYCSYMEYSNSFWELEDDGVLNNGIEIEFIYRDTDFLESIIGNLFDNKQANMGYSTCFYDNLMNSLILFDRNNYLLNLREKNKNKYTKEISDVIISKNKPLLRDSMPALFKQIKKATLRDDKIAVNHRITEFFAIYYDILFAANLVSHPGEKRLLEYSLKLKKLPKHYERNTKNIFESLMSDYDVLLKNLDELITELFKII